MPVNKTTTGNISGREILLRCVLLGAGYFILANSGYYLSMKDAGFVSFWLPSGLYGAMLFVSDMRIWPFLILSACAGNVGFDLSDGKPLWLSLIFSTGNSLEAVAGVVLFRKFSRGSRTIDSVKEVGWFFLCNGIAATGVSALIGVAALEFFFGTESVLKTFLLWWSGDFMGVLILMPLCIIWHNRLVSKHGRESLKIGTPDGMKFLLMLAASCALSYVIFSGIGGWFFDQKYLLLFFLGVSIMWFEPPFSALIVFAAVMTAAITTTFGLNLAVLNRYGNSLYNYIILNFFLGSTSIMSLAISSLLAEKRKTDDIIARTLKEKELLLKEMQHRIKNNLNTITGIIGLEEQKIKDKGVKTIFKVLKNKLASISIIHNTLYQAEAVSHVNITEFLVSLIQSVRSLYQNEALSVKYTTDICDMDIAFERLIPLGLMIHEILTNAYKHAFTGRNDGHIEITMTCDDGRYTLHIRDDGIGMKPDIDLQQGKSQGVAVIMQLARQIRATVTLDRSKGTAYLIEFE